MEGDVSHWQDEQLAQYTLLPQPVHLTDRELFTVEFKAHWTDPYEGEKALDRILKGQIIQRTSVKAYNDQFNKALSLTMETGANAAILRSYETGLKANVRIAAIGALVANRSINFRDRQTLMVYVDEALQSISCT